VRFPHSQFKKFRRTAPQTGAIRLVDHQQNRGIRAAIANLLAPAQNLGNFPVGGRHAADGIHNEQDHIRFLDGDFCLGSNFLNKFRRSNREGGPPALRGINSTGIHNEKWNSAPFPFRKQPVPGGAGSIIHNCQRFTRQAVKQGAFAHIGAPHQGDNRFSHCSPYGLGVAVPPRAITTSTVSGRMD